MNRNRSTDSNASSGNKINLTLAQYSQTDSQRNVDAILYFVVPKSFTETTCTPKLISAYKLCQDYELNAVWITEEDLLKTKPKHNNVFVVDPFSGSAFSYLEGLFFKSKKFVIIGPQCIHYSIQRQETDSQIQNRGFPFYTMGMQNICVSLSGFDREVQNELTDMVQKMNGIVSKPYSVATTHVVAAHVLTAKCREAYKNDGPVMSEDWIRNVWADSQNEIIDATDGKYIKYTCGLFHNVNICVSQVPSSLKKTISNIITAGGGIYSKDFTRYQTQVLIVPMASGDKYVYAKQWDVPCVTPEWVTQSKDAGHVLPFENFRPQKRPAMCSTQITGETDVHLPDFSTITSMSAIGMIMDQSRLEIANSTRFTELSMISAADKDAEIVKKSEIEILRNAATGFLDGCTIYLCNHDNEKLNELRIILNGSGATRLSMVNDMITHVVIINGHISEKEIKEIKNLGSQPHILPMAWLLECANAGQAVKEEPFEIELQSKSVRNSNNSQKQNASAWSAPNRPEEPNKSGNKTQEHVSLTKRNSSGSSSSLSINPNRNESLEKSVKPSNQTQSITRSVFQRPDSSQTLRDKNDEVEELENLGDNVVVPLASTTTTVDDQDFFLAGLKFLVKLAQFNETEKVETRIREANGEVLTERNIEEDIDVIILPPVYEPHGFTALQTFTKYWLHEVIAEKSLEIVEQVYHVPFLADESLRDILHDVVLAISAYSAIAKEYITTLASFMGANVQEVFARKNSNNTRKTTHLICSVTSNDKYRAAQRWGTPVVSCEWIIECYKRGSRLDHTAFLLQTDDSDSTISILAKTPSTQMKYQNIAKLKVSSKATSSRHDPSVNIIPASVNPKSSAEVDDNGFRRPRHPDSVATKLNFNTSLGTSPAPQSPLGFKTPVAFTKSIPEQVESPLLYPGMSREGSRQLKRALDLAAESSPSDSELSTVISKRRKSTPLSKIMSDIRTVVRTKIQANLNSDFASTGTNNVPVSTIGRGEAEEEKDGGISLTEPEIVNEEEDEETEDEIRPVEEEDEDNPKCKRAKGVSSNPKLSSATNSTGYNSASSRKGSTLSLGNAKASSSYLVKTKVPPPAQKQDKFGSLADIAGNSEVEDESKIVWAPDPHQEEMDAPARSSNNEKHQDKVQRAKGHDRNNDDHQENAKRQDAEKILEEGKSKTGKSGSKATATEDERTSLPKDLEDNIQTGRQTRNRGAKSSASSTSSKTSTAGSVRSGRGRKHTETATKKNSNDVPIPSEKVLRFALSGASSNDKVRYKEVLEKLGGVMSQIDNYDPATDAVIATKVARSEKILGAIAGGKPLLHPSYIEASEKAGKLLDIEQYIWWVKQANSDSEKTLIKAAQSWFRKIKEDSENAPFSKFRACVCEEKASKREAYKRLIEAGGGKITTDTKAINIVVGEGAEAKRMALECKVPIKIPMFLNNVIISFDYDGVDELLGIS